MVNWCCVFCGADVKHHMEIRRSLFLQEAEKNHLLNLAGHRSVGGMRASIYNAVPLEGVQALVNFMDDFAKRNG